MPSRVGGASIFNMARCGEFPLDRQLAGDFHPALHEEICKQPLTRMQEHRMAFLDTLILNLAERSPDVEAFVTWNAKHFKDKSSLVVLTPEEYLGS